MFKNMKLGVRLGVGFGLLVAMMVVVGLIALSRIEKIGDNVHLVVEDRMPKMERVNEWIDAVHVVARVLRNGVISDDRKFIEKEFERIPAERERIDNAIEYLDSSITSEAGKKLLEAAMAQRAPLREGQTKIMDLALAGQDSAAAEYLFGDYRDLQAKYLQALADLNEYQAKLAEDDGDSTAGIVESTKTLIVLIASLAALLAGLIAWFITVSITKPVAQCIDIAEKVAKGETGMDITISSNDEIGVLMGAMKQMTGTLNGLVSQMKSMSDDHTRGEIDTQIDVAKFQGAFADMARGINEMVFGHIAVKKKAMACVGEFGRGNFDAPLEKFPGKKAFINDTIEKVRENLKGVNEDTIMLVKAALEGRLSTRADASKHQGDFRKIIQGINDTLDAVINPVNEAAQVLEKVASRDLTARVMGNYQGDLGRIKMAVNTAVDNLDKALGQVGQATLQVSSAAQQISAGSQSLAQGANEQASSLEEVSSSLEEMASMTRQNADNALQAKNLAGEADGNAKQGSEAMSRMDTAIVKIKDSSDQTAKIVKTIDEIAMQTNLLALNAAVEAARAGEAGRGFAVVAEEVRNLAQRSAQAAKSTADMIGESVKNADEGVKIAREVAKSFESIAVSSRKVNDLIAEIASASKEQSQGIEQVNSAVSQMDKVTQQTAANAEESASSSEELSSQAEELQSMVAQFQITQEMGASRTAPALGATRRPALPPPARKISAPPPAKRNRSVNPEDVIPMDDVALREF